MKEYIIDENERKQYITNFTREKNGTLSVEFADGRVFNNIEYSDENIEKIITIQEEQARRGIDHYKVFKRRLNTSKIKTAAAFVGTLGASIGATFIPAVSQAVESNHPLVVCLGIGAVTVLGTIPAYAKLYRDSKVVEELDKIKYRDTHRKELATIRDHENSLAGLDQHRTGWMKRVEDPFSIANIDRYDIEDLETIVDNINVENNLGLTYVKRKVH